jgi:Protein of unknown function (DUF1647)
MLTIVSAASSNHFKSLCQFIRSTLHLKSIRRVVYDLGLNDKEREEVSAFSILLEHFDFSQYPEWMHISNEAGQYAWKSVIVKKVMEKYHGIVLWCDAGNIITDDLQNLRRIIYENGIYTAISQGRLKDWTVPQTIEKMEAELILDCKMRNAACIGFNTDVIWVQEFINKWNECCLQKDIIAPSGSSRKNNRHDQTILTILFEKFKVNNFENYVGYSIHNDCD